MALAVVRQHQIYIASESGFGLESEFGIEEEADTEAQPPQQAAESPEEGEEPESRERIQKRRHDVGYATRYSGREAVGGTVEEEERDAGNENLKELKAALKNKNSLLMTTAFML